MTEEKQFNIEVLVDIDSRFSEQKKLTMEIEHKGETKEFALYIDQEFRPSKIRTCVEDLVDKMHAVRKINRLNQQEIGEAYLVYMLIKHFTSFPSPELMEDEVKVIQMLIDNGLLYRIYAHFNPDQLEKVQEEVRDYAEKIDEGASIYMDIGEKIGLNNLE